ncbi:MAG TPA: hypothetical protein VFK14_03285 [Solirubrobacterales bacterium]|nr:hypothetical protein [Solirubrobacterales bacterium]
MRWLLPLLAASLVVLGLSLSSAGARRGGGGSLRPPAESAKRHPEGAFSRTHDDVRELGQLAPLRVGCERPRTLRLRRFEDRSARLECAGRVLVRVSVPG